MMVIIIIIVHVKVHGEAHSSTQKPKAWYHVELDIIPESILWLLLLGIVII